MKSWPIDWGCLPAGRWINTTPVDLLLIRGSPVPQRFDERGHMMAVAGRQLVDAGDKELPVVRAVLPRMGLVVAVQPGGRSGRRADHGDRHVEPFGERADRGRARRPDQAPRRRLPRRLGMLGPFLRKIRPAIRRACRPSHQGKPQSPRESPAAILTLTNQRP
jgi:hypothetical protein